MNSIRATIKATDSFVSPISIWTNLRDAASKFINENPAVFQSICRMGAPFGEGITRR